MKKIILLVTLICPLVFIGAACGTKQGGIFASFDGGETWERKSENYSALDLADIADIAISPIDRTLVYVATKDKGLFRSSDSGKNWALIKNFQDALSLLKIHPLNQDVLYLVSGRGLLKSVDRGNTFKEIFYEQQVSDIDFHPREENIIYISTLEGSILKSNDSGDSWQTLYWEETKMAVSGGFSQIEISLTNPNIIFAITGSTQIIKSIDGGYSFEKLDAGIKSRINDLEIQDDNTLYIASDGGLLKTGDGGKTIKEVKTLTPPKSAGIRILKASPQNNNILYYVTKEAIYKTIDSGNTWKVFRIATGVQYTTISVSPEDPNIIFVGARARSGYLLTNY